MNRGPHSPPRWFDRVLATTLGLVFVLYAVAKFAGTQFIQFELDAPMSDVSPVTLVWYFFGYSRPYALAIAVTELAVGLLVMVPRTARIGYPLYLAVASNVAMIDWCFGLPRPATLLATSLVVGAAVLIVRERSAYLALLAPCASSPHDKSRVDLVA
ncbi:MAG: hypothetical protein AB7O24_05405 [Kofleriaceae bacterium]